MGVNAFSPNITHIGPSPLVQQTFIEHILSSRLTVKWPGGSDGKESTCKGGDLGSIPGSGRSPGGGHGYPLQCFCLENAMDRGAWWATVHGGRTELDKTEVT